MIPVPRSLRGRLCAAAIILYLMVCAVAWLAISAAVEKPALKSVNGQLETLARELRGVWASSQITGAYPQLDAAGDMHWSIVDSRGEVFLSEIFDAEGVVPPSLSNSGEYEAGFFDTPIGALAFVQRTLTETPPLRDGETANEMADVTYTVAMSAARHSELVAERTSALQQAALRGFIAFGALMLGVIGALIALVLIPLRRLDRAAESFDAGLTPKIMGRHPTEIDDIVSKLNASIERNDGLVERTRRYIGKIAHDLKHPLAVARTAIATGEGKETATARLAAMDGTLDRYASLATSIGPDGPQPVILLAPFLEDAKAGFELLYRATPVKIETNCDPALSVRMARSDLDAIVTNLMSNAHRHAKGEIYISADYAAPSLFLTLEDDGPGLDPKQRTDATLWGKRLDAKAPGSGFGLAIVSDLAELYGGKLVLGESSLGGLEAKVAIEVPTR